MDLSSDSSRPLLSIVAAVYNGEKFLPQFFDCLQKQTLPDWELILVNDGSKDNTDAVLREWQDKFPSVTILDQANQGVSVARNTGFAVATGKYITFPDIDDVIHPQMYGRLLETALAGNWMWRPAMAHMFMKTGAKRGRFSRLIACVPPA